MSDTATDFREPKWRCSECNYAMDAATCPNDLTATPGEGDLTICLNCGHLYVRHSDRWVEPTVDEYLSFPRGLKDQVDMVRKARARIVTDSLVREDA